MSRTLVAQHPAARLAAGTGLLRQAVPDRDAASIRDFVCELSPHSQYLRFFAAVAPPSTGLLRALCGAGDADVLLVTDATGGVIGHGMAADESAGAGLASSIGLAVADAWQRRGIGTLLLHALISRATSRGVGSLIFEVLPANRVMLGIIGRHWPEACSERTPDALVFRPAITPRLATAERPLPSHVDLTGERCTRRPPAAA